MAVSSPGVTLAPLKSAAGPELERLRAGISSLELAPGQEAFVGRPGLRHPRNGGWRRAGR